MRISVVIPTLNEADNAAAIMRQTTDPQSGFFEVVVADGGSTDDTVKICRQFRCRVLELDRVSRGYQLDCGARAAGGDILLFLHADVTLPANAAAAVRNAMSGDRIVAGGFSKVFDTRRALLNGGRGKCRLRLRVLGTISGDQGLFMRKSTYEDAGGYPHVAVMEEFYLCRRLRRLGRIVLLPECLTASARRFLRYGVVRCYLRMFFVTLLFHLRFPPRVLERAYGTEHHHVGASPPA